MWFFISAQGQCASHLLRIMPLRETKPLGRSQEEPLSSVHGYSQQNKEKETCVWLCGQRGVWLTNTQQIGLRWCAQEVNPTVKR